MSIREHLGLEALSHASTDAWILILHKFVRMLAYGQTTLVLGVFFQELGVADSKIGLFMTLTLLGDVVISYVLTLYADRMGRRLIILVGASSMMASGAIFAMCSNYWILLAAAVIGVISPSGDEIGPFRSVEESTLAHLTTYEERSDIFAWSSVLGTLGNALGTLSGGYAVSLLQTKLNWSTMEAYRGIFWLYTTWAGIKFVMALFLSPECEAESWTSSSSASSSSDSRVHSNETQPLLQEDAVEEDGEGNDGNLLVRQTTAGYMERRASDHCISESFDNSSDPTYTRRTLIKLAIAFGLDSVGYSFMPYSWLVLYFVNTFGSSAAALGTLLFVTYAAGSITAIGSSVMCKKLGPIRSIVLTKLPSTVFMTSVSLAKEIIVAMVLVVLAVCTDTMDVVPRQVFIASVVPAQDRTMVMGTVNVVKTLARSIGPTVTGIFSEHDELWLSFWFLALFQVLSLVCVVTMFHDVKYH